MFLPAVAANQPNTLLGGLVREVIGYAGRGIPGRKYLREQQPARPQS
ncbi:hypothetical protein [Hymenobacter sp. UYCo722]